VIPPDHGHVGGSNVSGSNSQVPSGEIENNLLFNFYNCSRMKTSNTDKVDHDEKSTDDYEDEEIIIIKFAVSFSRMS
jgi:hypothetical protein